MKRQLRTELVKGYERINHPSLSNFSRKGDLLRSLTY